MSMEIAYLHRKFIRIPSSRRPAINAGEPIRLSKSACFRYLMSLLNSLYMSQQSIGPGNQVAYLTLAESLLLPPPSSANLRHLLFRKGTGHLVGALLTKNISLTIFIRESSSTRHLQRWCSASFCDDHYSIQS